MMYLSKRWDEIMGPKDEQLAAVESKAVKTMANILLVGTISAIYYNLSLEQVAEVTDHPVLTSLGQSVDITQLILILTLIVAAIASLTIQTRSGFFSSRKRFAEVDRIPWDLVAITAVVCGLIVGVLTFIMRVLAEIQLVGIENVMWIGDLAVGGFFFMLGFVLGFVLYALTIHDAIKQRHRIEAKLEN